LSIKDTKDQTALSYAAGINIKAALAAFNIQDKNDLTSLTYAEEKKSIEIVKLLLQAGASVDVQSKEGTTPLMNAAARNHTEIVKLLLEARADSSIKDTKGQTALTYANTYAKYAEVSRLHSTIELLTQSLDNFQKKNGATP
jgi:ankyrin repeat protein